MNEKGLAVNVFYHPRFAEYPEPKPERQAKTLETLDVVQYLLTTCQNTAEVRKAIMAVDVVGLVEPKIGLAPPIHLFVTDQAGKSVVIEFVKGEVQIFDAPFGCITNAPSYDWQITNLRNYLNLS